MVKTKDVRGGALVRADGGVPDSVKPKSSPGRPSKAALRRAQRNLNDRQIRFCQWLAQPEQYRHPATQVELAAELGVHPVTLSRWVQQPKIIQAVRWLVIHNTGDPVRISSVVDFLHQVVENESESTRIRLDAAREFLSAVGVKQVWKQDSPEVLRVSEVDELHLEDLSDEELWDLYKQHEEDIGLNEAPDDSGVVDAELVDDGSDD